MWPVHFFAGLQYKGFDVVDGLSARMQADYGTASIKFFEGDFLLQELPPADLLLCKEVLVHLSDIEIHQALNIAAKYPLSIFCHAVGKNPSIYGRVAQLVSKVRQGVSIRTRFRQIFSRSSTVKGMDIAIDPALRAGGFRHIDLLDSKYQLGSHGLSVKKIRDFVPKGQSHSLTRIWLLVSDSSSFK